MFFSVLVQSAPVNYSNAYAPDLCLTPTQAAEYNCSKVGVCGTWGLDRYSCPLAPLPSQEIVVTDFSQSIQTNHWKIVKALNGIRGFVTEIYSDHLGFAFYDLHPMFVSFIESVKPGDVLSYAGATYKIERIYSDPFAPSFYLAVITVNTSLNPSPQPTPSPSPTSSPSASPTSFPSPTPSLQATPSPSPTLQQPSPTIAPSATIVITGSVNPTLPLQPLGDECSGNDRRVINQIPSYCKRGKWVPQLAAGSYCMNGFECESGRCENNACTIPEENAPPQNFLDAFMRAVANFFRSLFGIGS